MLRLAEGMHTPIALHCSGFIFNVGKSGRNRQILTEHFVNVRPFLFPFTISECNLIYYECVNLFYIYMYLSRILWFSRTNTIIVLKYVVWDRFSKIWLAALILLQELRSNTLKRSPTIHAFLAF